MRRQSPNTQHRGGFQRGAKERVHIGQIISVDDMNGQVKVSIFSTGEEYKLQIPLGGFSLKGFNSSWDRYMPQEFDFVKVGFQPDNTPEILAYAAFGEELDPSGQRQGSIAAPRQSLYATARRAAEADPDGFGLIFRRLKQGEWDRRSSGGAYMLGTQDGTLTLAGGGGADIKLVKNRREFQSRSGLHIFSDDGVEVRFGQVKRRIEPAGETVPVAPNPGAFGGGTVPVGLVPMSSLREHKVSVGFSTPLTALSYYDSAAGTPTTPIGTPELAIPSPLAGLTQLVPFPPNALRSRSRWYGLDGLTPSVTVEVDFLGNIQVSQLPTAGIGLTASFARLFLHGQTNASLAATGFVFLGSEGARLSRSAVPGALGVPQAYVLGTAWTVARRAFHTALAIANTALATAMTAAQPLPPLLQAPAIVIALQAYTTAVLSAIGAFETAGGPTGFLSATVFGE